MAVIGTVLKSEDPLKNYPCLCSMTTSSGYKVIFLMETGSRGTVVCNGGSSGYSVGAKDETRHHRYRSHNLFSLLCCYRHLCHGLCTNVCCCSALPDRCFHHRPDLVFLLADD